MNYVWSKEPTEPDAWLADMDEAAMEKSIGEAAEAMKVKFSIFNIIYTTELKVNHSKN